MNSGHLPVIAAIPRGFATLLNVNEAGEPAGLAIDMTGDSSTKAISGTNVARPYFRISGV